MLEEIAGILRRNGFLAPGDEPAYDITAISAQVMNIALFKPDGTFFHVRVKEGGDLPAEFDKYCDAWRLLPRYVPEPLGRYFTSGREVMVIRGVEHRRVPFGDIGRDRHGMAGRFVEFFAASATGSRLLEPAVSHEDMLREVRRRTADATCAAVLDECIGGGRLETLPHIPQHGDFVLNNIGVGERGLVVFDWEDFARVSLPGLDLCTLLASDTRFDPGALLALMGKAAGEPSAHARIVTEVCPLIGLTTARFREMIPLYLAIFSDLKRAYASDVAARMRQTLLKLLDLAKSDGQLNSK